MLDGAVAAAALAVLAAWSLRQPVWKDFAVEARPAVLHLVHGDLRGFLTGSPVYAGSMLLRAPFFLLGYAAAGLAGAYRAGALACAAVLAALALPLAGELRRRGVTALPRALFIVLLVANPVAARAIQMGHPEDLLAAALCLAGTLWALRGRGLAAGAAIGVAIACKQWAALALPLALAAAPGGRRWRLLVAAVAAAGALLAPFALASPSGFTAANRGALGAPAFINAENVWRLFGAYHLQSFGVPGARAAWDVPDAFPAADSHSLILLVAAVVAAAAWRRRYRLREADWLLLLAGCALLRGLLDPWNIVYYQLPFVLSLLVWEVRAGREKPLLSAAALAAVWIPFQTLGTNGLGDGIDAALSTRIFCAWAIPAALALLGIPLLRGIPLPRPLRLLPRPLRLPPRRLRPPLTPGAAPADS